HIKPRSYGRAVQEPKSSAELYRRAERPDRRVDQGAIELLFQYATSNNLTTTQGSDPAHAASRFPDFLRRAGRFTRGARGASAVAPRRKPDARSYRRGASRARRGGTSA